MEKSEYTAINSRTWDGWVQEGNPWTVPVSHEAFLRARHGEWDVVLTPKKPVPKEWFPALQGARVLGLASGGGQQCPIFSALGASVTVFDNSQRQLDSEAAVASREGYAIRMIKGDMTKRLPFDDESFDLIFHPVSNCYIQDVLHVWREAFRVLRHGGVLLAGFANPVLYALGEDEHELELTNRLPYDPIKNFTQQEFEREAGSSGVQFSHSLETQIGGQIEAGFRLGGLYEDYDTEGVIARYMPTFIATKAVRE
ncbi:MAG: class I SAM-dependent methyltransferase [Clostridia bacterium]|nr:class I SAM-dependent methyltransferase [Clostridia bacterium]